MEASRGHQGDKLVTWRFVGGAIGLLLLAACASGGSGTGDPDPELGTATSAETNVATTDMGVEPSTTGPTRQTSMEPSSTGSAHQTATQPEAVTSLGDITGTYETTDSDRVGFLRILADAMHWAPDEDSPQIELGVMFDGSNALIEDPDCGEGIEGIYVLHVLETGHVEIVLVEDPCRGRADQITGEYRPVN